MSLSLSKLMAVADKATDGDWFVVEPPYLPRDTETYVIAESPDPHVGVPVCDFMDASTAGAEDIYEDTEWSSRNYANAAHIATFDPPTVKRLLAHSALLIEVLPIIEDGIETEAELEAEHSVHARKLAARIRAALEGVEL